MCILDAIVQQARIESQPQIINKVFDKLLLTKEPYVSNEIQISQ